jgi:hypothetical protein
LSSSNRSETFILCLLTFLAALRGILKTFVSEELLFARCPDEVAVAVDTMDGSVLKLRIGYRGNYYF